MDSRAPAEERHGIVHRSLVAHAEFVERCEFYRLNGRCPQVPAALPD